MGSRQSALARCWVPNSALSKTCLIRSGLTTPSAEDHDDAIATTATRRRYGRKVATTRRTVVREIGRLSSSDSGAAKK